MKLEFDAPIKAGILKNPALTKWVHIAKSGDNRNETPIDPKMFPLLIEEFYSTKDARPIYVGHVDHERKDGETPAPAQGWILALHAEGSDLYAYVEFRDALAKEILDGGYAYCSIYAGTSIDEEGQPRAARLYSVAVLNDPGVPDLMPLAASQEKNKNFSNSFLSTSRIVLLEDSQLMEQETKLEMTPDKAMEMLEALRAKMSEASGSEMSMEDLMAELMAMVGKTETDSAPSDSEAMQTALGLAKTRIEELETEIKDLKLANEKAEAEKLEKEVDSDIASVVSLQAKRDELIKLARTDKDLYKTVLSMAIPKAPTKEIVKASDETKKDSNVKVSNMWRKSS